MAAKISWHRHETKLRHTVTLSYSVTEDKDAGLRFSLISFFILLSSYYRLVWLNSVWST